MTKILIHELPLRTAELIERLTGLLTSMGDEAVGLTTQLERVERRRPSLVLTGQFSSGKSTLINALTDGEAHASIGVDVTTDQVTEYEWGHEVVLVDTPGVQSGLRDHDAVAEGAIVSADLILFTMTPDLLDDAGRAHLVHVADDLGRRDQMIVVLTMKNTMEAAPGVRQQAIDDVLSASSGPRVVECDAADYLEGGEFVAISGVDDVREAINELTERTGQLAVDRQPLQLVAAVAAEATSMIVDDPTEHSLLHTIAGVLKILVQSEARLHDSLKDLRVRLESQARREAGRFVDAIDEQDALEQASQRDDMLESAQKALKSILETALDETWAATETAVRSLEANIDAEVETLARSPQATEVRRMVEGAAREPGLPSPGGRVSSPIRNFELPAAARKVLEDLGPWVQRLDGLWGHGTDSNGHRFVKMLGGQIGHKFRPWEAVNIAGWTGTFLRRAGTAAKFIGPAIDSGQLVLGEVERMRLEREVATRRQRIVEAVVEDTSATVRTVHSEVVAALADALSATRAELFDAQAAILAVQHERDARGRELVAVIENARSMLPDRAPLPQQFLRKES